jgi:hypothetical protein
VLVRDGRTLVNRVAAAMGEHPSVGVGLPG